jgi:hypothetical protein
MRKTYWGMAVAAGLLSACAGQEIRDEGLLRIEEAMRPETKPPPEGIELGLDAPPLAPPDRDIMWAPVYSFPQRMGEVGTNSPWFYSGPMQFPSMGCPHHGHMGHMRPQGHPGQMMPPGHPGHMKPPTPPAPPAPPVPQGQMRPQGLVEPKPGGST